MQKTKVKRDVALSGRLVPYVVMYVLIAVIGVFLTSTFITSQPYRYLPRERIEIAVFAMGFIPAFLHVQLTERYLKRSMRGWLVATMIGTLITVLLFSGALGQWRWPASLERLQIYLIATGPTLLLQTFWLWRRYKRAWLRPLITFVPILFLPQLELSFDLDDSFISTGPFVALYAVIPAVILYHILARPRTTEKAKIDFAVDNASDHERLERLQDYDRERSNPLWNQGDDQTLQSEA